MEFWLIAGLISALVAALLGRSLLRGQDGVVDAAAYDVQVYRDQLSEVDRDVARGVLGEAEAERTRTEISRRLLAADAAAQSVTSKGARTGVETWGGLTLAAILVTAGGLGLYSYLGKPQMADMPLENRLQEARDLASTRLSQAAFEAQMPVAILPEPDPSLLNLVEQLRDVVKERPDDLRGFQLLARNEASLGNYTRAYAAQNRIIELKGDAVETNDYLTLADYYMIAAQGYISPEAEDALSEAIRREPQNGFARYYTGLLMMQTGRPDLTFRFWRALLEEGPENAPWIAPIRANIDDLAWIAGVRYDPPAPRGPSAEDIAAAESLSATDRAAMIEGMVASLSDRLASEGGSAQEWAQLITALGVLGRTGDAKDIWTEAQELFNETPEGLAMINQAAANAGLTEE
ncbi:c-type cytochrome biogenesis protein CcmI [Cognatishimia sp. D5M38]|uniref:C-type cytochrome biogenesis protein CcmI n=1 Tax=Cognatishimia coralii TaxID=3083254 RepID=A0ABU8QBI1_9RHOB